MLTQTHLNLHNKAVEILEAVKRCDYFINDAKKYLNNNTKAPWFECTKHIYAAQHRKYKGIKARLLMSYANVMEKLSASIMQRSNAKVFGKIVVSEDGVTGCPTLDHYTQLTALS